MSATVSIICPKFIHVFIRFSSVCNNSFLRNTLWETKISWFELFVRSSLYTHSTTKENLWADKLCKTYKVAQWSNNQIKAPATFVCGVWEVTAKWAFGLMHYGKDKGSAKTMPPVQLRRGKTPDKHMVYSILLSLWGPSNERYSEEFH